MIVAMPEEVLEKIIKRVIGIGVKKKEIDIGEKPAYISMNEASKRYGRVIVEGWIKAGVVKRYKDNKRSNSRIRISVLELEAAACCNNLYTGLKEVSKCDVDIINQERMSQFKDIEL
ncbi:hypothetical protein [Parabacteroides sp. AM08-6]|uniref:hypothetical protein n=1 Tax=Parabacteroides sp. AM08-6 TaxID=2292053 RepID=UPI000EFDB938|nr:hypothetical protein [Parabacteroides sp. AM08-6]RHJ78088.1 hypothetical protein DW103_15260 [Parabacteroides sp. AM08-6]